MSNTSAKEKEASGRRRQQEQQQQQQQQQPQQPQPQQQKQASPTTSSKNSSTSMQEKFSMEAFQIEVSNAQTAVQLLSSPEENLVINVMKALDNFVRKSFANAACLDTCNIILPLVKLTYHQNPLVVRLALKIMSFTLCMPNTKKYLYEKTDAILHIATLFVQRKTDPILREFASHVLSVICQEWPDVFMLYRTGIVDEIFQDLSLTTDPDIQKNCIEVLSYIVQCKGAEENLTANPNFDLKTIMCYLRSEFCDIQSFAYTIMSTVAQYEGPAMAELMNRNRVVTEMFRLLTEPDHKEYVPKIFDIIDNCMKHASAADRLVRSREFIMFLHYIETAEKQYLGACTKILVDLTEQQELRQILFDCGVDEALMHLLKNQGEGCTSNAVYGLINLAENPHCLTKMISDNLINDLVDVLKNVNLPWNPHRQAPILLLLEFAKKDFRTLGKICDADGLSIIMKMFSDHRKDLADDIYLAVIEIVLMLVVSAEYRTQLYDISIFVAIMALFKDDNERIVLKALTILQEYLIDSQTRQWFLGWNGVQLLSDMLSNPSINVKIRVLNTIMSLCKYKGLGVALIVNGMIPRLLALRNALDRYPIYKSTIAMLYSFHLPLKFYDTGRLEIDDTTKDDFYVVSGKLKEFCPVLEVMQFQCTFTTVYVATIGTEVDTFLKSLTPVHSPAETPPSERTVRSSEISPSAASPSIDLIEKKSKATSMSKVIDLPKGKRKNLMKNSSKPSLEPIEDTEEKKDSKINSMKELKSEVQVGTQPVRKKATEIRYGEISPDPYLPEYLQEAFFELKTTTKIEDRVVKLARFVALKLSLENGENGFFQPHSLECHLFELKKKLGTNIIPLGYLRIGSYLERAMLFKVLADRLNVPSTLVRGKMNIAWNEVPTANELFAQVDNLGKAVIRYHVVDLMVEIGRLIPCNSFEAFVYCKPYSQEAKQLKYKSE